LTLRLHINGVGLVMGGGVTHLERLVPALVEVRPDWEVVVYLSPRGPALSVPGVRTELVNRASWRRLVWDSLSVGRRARATGADVLLNLANSGPVRSRIPSVLYQRNALYFDRTWVDRMGGAGQARAMLRRKLAFAQMQHAAAVVVPSEAMAGYLRSWRGCPSDVPIEVIPHGVDLERFRFSPAVGTGRIRLVSLSHAAPHKDQGLLVALVADLVGRGADVELEATIADEDDPAYVAVLREQVRRSGLEERIRFVGRVAAPQFLAGANLMVIPSITESFGFPVIEAMASGVPVVASEIPSFVELLGDLGWYFTPGNPTVAADRVMAVVNAAPIDLHRRVSAARRLATQYTWERNARHVVELIETVVGERRTGG
jgi:glycosyltransferase involved in cell wall biosynthesis